MSEPFLIRHPDGREYELSDPAYFVDHYQPQGFAVVDPAPTGYSVPDLPTAAEIQAEREEELQKQKRTELNGVAAALGIEKPESFANKDALIEAIQAAQELRERELNESPGETN